MSACAPTKEIIKDYQPIYLTVPESIYKCPDEPKEPDIVDNQSDAGYYIIQLKDFARKCKASSEAVEKWNTEILSKE